LGKLRRKHVSFKALSLTTGDPSGVFIHDDDEA
jgi:hypothetical protein